MFLYGKSTPDGDSSDSFSASTRLVSVTTTCLRASGSLDARLISPWKGESGPWLSMSTRAEGSFRADIRGDGAVDTSGSNSVTRLTGSGATVLTRKNCSRCTANAEATKPATGTAIL